MIKRFEVNKHACKVVLVKDFNTEKIKDVVFRIHIAVGYVNEEECYSKKFDDWNKDAIHIAAEAEKSVVDFANNQKRREEFITADMRLKSMGYKD